MAEPTPEPETEYSPHDREYQDSHYHDEDAEIQLDDLPHHEHAATRKKPPRRPQPKRRFVED